jgi:DNA-binding NtrC family response regulator
VIQVENLPPDLLQPPKKSQTVEVDLKKPLADYLQEAVSEIEREYITKALLETRGQVSQCAEICGLSRRSITAKMNEYQLQKDDFKNGGIKRDAKD